VRRRRGDGWGRRWGQWLASNDHARHRARVAAAMSMRPRGEQFRADLFGPVGNGFGALVVRTKGRSY
jgi:hypothetical protein